MQHVHRTVAWGCICSTLFMGCYSSVLIDPAGEEKESIRSDEIECVVRKDRTQYQFETPPTVAGEMIVGIANGDSVSIPISDVYRVQVSQFNVGGTVAVGIIVIGGVILIATAKGPERKIDLTPMFETWLESAGTQGSAASGGD